MSLQNDIDRGLEIVREMARLETELKQIKARVDAAALNGKQIPLEDPDRDGMQFLANGSAEIVPVVITADYLAKSFTNASPKHQEVLESLGGGPKAAFTLADFYGQKIVHERSIDDGKKFRSQARLLLGAEAVGSREEAGGGSVNAFLLLLIAAGGGAAMRFGFLLGRRRGLTEGFDRGTKVGFGDGLKSERRYHQEAR